MRIKNFIIILLVIICAVGCARCKEKGEMQMDKVEYKEGSYPVKNWNEVGHPFEKDCVTDKESAIYIGNAVLSQFQNQGYFPNYTLQEIFNDIGREVWILSYWESMCVGSSFSIAISKKDSQIIRMWVEE